MPESAKKDALRMELTFPSTSISLGPLKVDLLKKMTGKSLTEYLEPVTNGVVTNLHTENGLVEVFPVELQPGQGVSLDLGEYGEVGIANSDGLFVLQVPEWAIDPIHLVLESTIVQGPTRVDGALGSVVNELLCRFTRGMWCQLPMGQFGQMGIKVL